MVVQAQGARAMKRWWTSPLLRVDLARKTVAWSRTNYVIHASNKGRGPQRTRADQQTGGLWRAATSSGRLQ
jgi:hypothetical protein